MHLKRLKIVFCLLYCVLVSVCSVSAQKNHFYHFNVNNGLPSNHVYQVVIDTYGYAWIATTKGVLKYNGYKFKKFSEKEGLPKDDIWMLVEDEYNRIWLNSKTYELGYIKNDKYRGVIRSTGGNGIYPKQMMRIKGGITFMSARVNFGQVYDTLDFYKVIGDDVSNKRILTKWTNPNSKAIDEQGNYSVMVGGGVYKLLKGADGNMQFRKVCSYPTVNYGADKYFECNNQRSIMQLGTIANKVLIYSLDNSCKTNSFSLDAVAGEHILATHLLDGCYHLSTNKRRIVLDGNMNVLQTYWLKDLMPESDTVNSSLVWFISHKLWKGFSTTSNAGIYQNLGSNAIRFDEKANFNEARYVGRNTSGVQYWWQNPDRKLISIYPDGTVVVKEIKQLTSVTNMYEIEKGKMLICSTIDFFVFDERTATVEPYLKNLKAIYAYGISMANSSKVTAVSADNNRLNGHDRLYGMVGDTVYSRAISRLCWFVCKDGIRTEKLLCPVSQVSDIDMRNMCSFSYYEGKVEVYNIRADKSAFLDSLALKQLGINKLKKIVVDKKRGEIFLLSNAGLYVYNPYSRSYKKLQLSINSSACNIEVFDDKIILLSEFGLVFYKRDASGHISRPVYVLNGKYSQYRYIQGGGFYVDDSVVRFNTDKGMCVVAMPHDNEYAAHTSYTDYRMLVEYNNGTKQLRKIDSLNVDPAKYPLIFDLINPVGAGEVSYRYSVQGEENTWTDLNANEWYPVGLLPGVYNKVYLQAYDDGWQSDVFVLYVYVEPLWWQTGIGKGVVAGAILFVLALIVVVVYVITKRVANRANARKNLQTELKNLRTEIELKSIHAQINPHFIFNTLSTGLYFIKKKQFEDAYDHISAFSELLRNYIKSSRDKYISLNEEVENLRKYVLLQQARFENLFDFVVDIAEGINPYTEKIPALLLQPLIENAINHGLFHTGSTGGRLLLSFSKSATDILVCVIDDNGVGRERSKDIKSDTKHKTQSYGTDLIKELIETFNRYEPVNITIEYVDKQLPETGTTVVLTIQSLA